MSAPLSLRLDAELRAGLRQQAEREGVGVSTLAQRLIDEGLRMRRHPDIVFRDGPAGRRAGVARGPDVVTIVGWLRHFDAAGEDLLRETAEWLNLPIRLVEAAADYYAEFPEEIDAWLAEEDRLASEEHARYERRGDLLA